MNKILFYAFMLYSAALFGQDSVKVKNNHGAENSTIDSARGGALIDTIHTSDAIPQKKSSVDPTGTPENRLKEIEKEITILKSKAPKNDASIRSAIASAENLKNDLKSRLNSAQKNEWEKDYNSLISKIDNIKLRVN